MVMMTYQLPDSIREIARGGEYDEFDLNTFFTAKGEGEEAEFAHKEHVQKWLNLIRGSFAEARVEDLERGAKKAPLPFAHAAVLSVLNDNFWLLPGVGSCHVDE